MRHKLTPTVLINAFIRDKNGAITIWQHPNFSLVSWFIFSFIAHVIHNSQAKNGFEFLSTAFLFTWAYLEAVKGVNYFRRLLGLLVLFVIVLAHFKYMI